MDLSELKPERKNSVLKVISRGSVLIHLQTEQFSSQFYKCLQRRSLQRKVYGHRRGNKRLMDAKEKAHARYDALAELCPNDSESNEDKSIENFRKDRRPNRQSHRSREGSPYVYFLTCVRHEGRQSSSTKPGGRHRPI
ncbi:Hypothetical protein FKW44_004984 [Caligus rogercresseyi]|uniref:Uncharacterized protein n=1 Tax=Caligus rogercresseyi TaxID=217165 RepID=A0A7T8HMH2_CALRO|nr:Hypothetical protein FKW44_004984 [Caligus rogercresseyi]